MGFYHHTVDACEILKKKTKGWLKPYKSWDKPPFSTGAGFRNHPPYHRHFMGFNMIEYSI